ncbi:MAG: RNB domain-containing ribonuclease, partial [Victivallaceae bacterium]
PGSDIDLEAETRGANLYLPEQTIHMLPLAVTHQLGLGLQETSPALSFAISFDEHGAPTLEKAVASRVNVTRYSYEQAETRLNEEPLCSIAPLLEKFRKFREENGALRIELPEVKIKVTAGEVIIKPLPLLQSREMVAESMMATGAAVGKFAVQHDIPLPFAVQPEPDIAGKPETLAGMFSARRGCTVTSVQTIPGRHSGLGLEPYVRITSPLRRYGDLLAHQQIRLYLAGKPLLPTVEIDGKIAKSESASGELRRLERVVNEFWKLVYLDQHPDWKGRAVVVERMDNRFTIMLPELAYEYKLRSANMELNAESIVTINAVDLPGMTARFTMKSMNAGEI